MLRGPMTRESTDAHGEEEQDLGEDAVARSPFAAALVAAGKDEGLSPARRERLLRNISLAVGVPLPLDTDIAEPTNNAPEMEGPSPPGGVNDAAAAAGVAKGVGVKLWGAVLLGGLATVGSAALVGSWVSSTQRSELTQRSEITQRSEVTQRSEITQRSDLAERSGLIDGRELALPSGVQQRTHVRGAQQANGGSLERGAAVDVGGETGQNHVDDSPTNHGAGAATAAVDVSPSAAVAEESSASKGARSVRHKPDSDTLSQELALIDSARASLLAGQPAAALRTLNAYRTQFPKGALRAEATVQRVEALIAVGDRRSAQTIGESFLTRNPESPYSRRIASLLGVAREPQVDGVRKNK